MRNKIYILVYLQNMFYFMKIKLYIFGFLKMPAFRE